MRMLEMRLVRVNAPALRLRVELEDRLPAANAAGVFRVVRVVAVALDLRDCGGDGTLGDGDAVDRDESLDVGLERLGRRGEGVVSRGQTRDVLRAGE